MKGVYVFHRNGRPSGLFVEFNAVRRAALWGLRVWSRA